MTSGPRELAAYHAQVLEQERQHEQQMRMRPESNVRNQAAQAPAQRPEAHLLPPLLAQTVPESENDPMMSVRLPNEEQPVSPEAIAKANAIARGDAPANGATAFDPTTVEAMPTPPARTRRVRSDKGVPKPAKPVELEPVQSLLSVNEIKRAAQRVWEAREALAAAQDTLLNAESFFDDCLGISTSK